MFEILYVISGFLFIVFVIFSFYLAYIVYKDEDDGYKNTIIDWIKEYRKDWHSWTHLKFNEWKKYYILAPDEWKLAWFAPKRVIRDKHGTWDTIYINFGFIGNIRYVLFKHNMENRRRKNKAAQSSQDNLRYVLEAVQRDIDKIQKKVEEEINKAKEETDKIRKSYLNEESYLNKETELKFTDKWENFIVLNINERFKVTPMHDTILTIYSDTNDTYLCWDAFDKYYYFGQKDDDNVIFWSSLEEFNKFYAFAIKNLSIMKASNLAPRCALLYKNK